MLNLDIINLEKKICFHINQCKMLIMYGNAVMNLSTSFQDQACICVGNAPFFHLMLFLLNKIVFCSVQKQMGQFYCMKIGMLHVKN